MAIVTSPPSISSKSVGHKASTQEGSSPLDGSTDNSVIEVQELEHVATSPPNYEDHYKDIDKDEGSDVFVVSMPGSNSPGQQRKNLFDNTPYFSNDDDSVQHVEINSENPVDLDPPSTLKNRTTFIELDDDEEEEEEVLKMDLRTPNETVDLNKEPPAEPTIGVDGDDVNGDADAPVSKEPKISKYEPTISSPENRGIVRTGASLSFMEMSPTKTKQSTKSKSPSCPRSRPNGDNSSDDDVEEVIDASKPVAPTLPLSPIPRRRDDEAKHIESKLGNIRLSDPLTPGSVRATRRKKRDSSRVNNIRLKELDEDEKKEWASVTKDVKKSTVLAVIKGARISLCGKDFACLRGQRWLNDEVLNSFFALINARNRAYFELLEKDALAEIESKGWTERNVGDDMDSDCKFTRCAELFEDDLEPGQSDSDNEAKAWAHEWTRPRTHVFNTFFFERYSQNGGLDYDGVKRWLRKAGKHIKDLDLILVPINLQNFHGVLAAIKLRSRMIVYMGSMQGKDSADVIGTLKQWLLSEVSDKMGDDVARRLNITNFKFTVNPLFVPRQTDSGSCGIFTSYLAGYLERGKYPDYDQSDIVTMRQRAVLFLKHGKLPEDL